MTKPIATITWTQDGQDQSAECYDEIDIRNIEGYLKSKGWCYVTCYTSLTANIVPKRTESHDKTSISA